MPGHLQNQTDNSTIPIILHVWMKGLCEDNEIHIRAQALVTSIDSMVFGWNGGDLFQPREVLRWRPSLYLKTDSFNANVTLRATHLVEFVNEYNQTGVPSPYSFDATLPLALATSEFEFGVSGWERMQILHPASDFDLDCEPVAANGTEPAQLIHVLPPMRDAPTARSLLMLKQQVAWDMALGVHQTLIYVTKSHRHQLNRDPVFRNWVAQGHVELKPWDRLYACSGKPSCLKRMAWSSSLVYLWDKQERWALMTDVDEFLVLPADRTVASFMTSCVQLAAISGVERFNVLCVDCGNESDASAWATDFPLAHYTLRAKEPFRGLGKSVASTRRTFAFGIHTGSYEGPRTVVDAQCGYVVHLPNLFRLRTPYNANEFIEDSTWLRNLGRPPMQAEPL